ncbi:hypothetical protein FRC02_011743 [Tulasnella sp. 418]|nr:hypothetical protein FRC02_011743 [Tulasnella sp. 418]
MLLFTLSSRVVMYSVDGTACEIDYGFHVKSTSSVAHSLSPDGKTLVRWILREENQASTISAIDIGSKQQIARLQRDYKCRQSDILNARWVDNSIIYIPASGEGIIIPWNIRDAVSSGNLLEDTFIEPEDPTVIRPFRSITRHGLLKFDVTKDRAWCTATGITLSDPPSGHIEVRNMRTDRSKILEGMVSCIAEVEVYDKEKALLVWASVTPDFKLRLRVQQVNPDDSGQSFRDVDVKIDTIEEKDYPRDIIVLHPLPIVAVMTEKSYIYFFELNTGAYLYSQAQKSYQLCPGLSDKGELLFWSHEKSDVQVLTVNERDLIGYCRKVLKDDTLASTIAIRTGLPGAEDVVLDEMYGQ